MIYYIFKALKFIKHILNKEKKILYLFEQKSW